MFLVTIVFLNTAKTKQELDNAVFQTAGIAQKYNCSLRRLDYAGAGADEQSPAGIEPDPIKRALTTTSTAIFVPFTTQELFMEGNPLLWAERTVQQHDHGRPEEAENPNGLDPGNTRFREILQQSGDY